MFRQIAFAIAFTGIVLASEFKGIPLPGQTSAQQVSQNQTPTKTPNRVPPFARFKNAALEKSVFEQINRYRVARGLPKLTLNASITRQARIHSQNMAKGKVPFSHQGFEKRVKATSIRFRSAAENVAFNQGYEDPAKQAVYGWLNSPEHLVNIKGNYNLTGIGVATNKEGEIFFTQIFIRNR